MTTALFTHPDCKNHEMPRHPERPERLTAVMDRIQQSGLVNDMTVVEASEIDMQHLLRSHPQHYIDQIIQGEPRQGAVKVETDTYMSPGSLRAARLAAGANLSATEAVLSGEYSKAFCAIRPPGHHAELASAMGFCLFNNVAIAAETALLHEDINRVAIVDFDVHHCNGTVDLFKDREEVLVCSSFQADFYPFRYLDFSNEHIISTDLAAGSNSQVFRRRVEQEWGPALQQHKPDFIFISAGFDAHKDDPLGQLNLETDDYRWATQLMTDIANDLSGGRVVSTLEGGYNLSSLADGAEAHLSALITNG